MMAELSLAIAPFGFEMSAVHVWSRHNATCDWLSRAALEETVLDVLRQAVRAKDKRPEWAALA